MARTVDPQTRPALLGAASRLFYREGLEAIGVDEIVAEAGLSKPTLYRHFTSKEDLVLAYLGQRHERLSRELHDAIDDAAASRRPLAVVDWLCSMLLEPEFNGCAFVRAAAEIPGDPEILARLEERKRELLDAITEAFRAAGAREPEELAAQLALIVEGASTWAYATGDRHGAAAAARSLAGALFRDAELESSS